MNSPELLIRGGTVIPGDGQNQWDNYDVVVDQGVILEVGPHEPQRQARRVMDARATCVLPGIINGHAHGCSTGPLFSSGAAPLDLAQALRNADRQLREGVTTLINVDGLPLMEEIAAVARHHPMRILAATSHLPATFLAARSVDGAGLLPEHLATTALAMLDRGAVALGEMGSGATLGGGVSSYRYLPEAVERATGLRIEPNQATLLKRAVLGSQGDPSACDLDRLAAVLEELGLQGRLSVEKARDMVLEIAYRPVEQSLLSFDEACELSAQARIPVVFHTAPPSIKRLLELGRRYQGSGAILVAGHCNHPDFLPQESVAAARACRDLGIIVDVSTIDGVSTRRMTDCDNLLLLVREGLADTISTDYGGGGWDSMLEGLQLLVSQKLLSLPQAVALATSAPARVFPLAAGQRGRVEPGLVADLVVTERYNLGRVRSVIVGGRVVIDEGFRERETA